MYCKDVVNNCFYAPVYAGIFLSFWFSFSFHLAFRTNPINNCCVIHVLYRLNVKVGCDILFWLVKV